MIDDLGGGVLRPVERPDARDPAVLDLDFAVLEVAVTACIVEALRLGNKGEHPASQEFPGHCDPSRYQATSSARSSSVMSVTLPGGMAWL